MIGNVLSLLGMLLIVIVVLVLAYGCTRFLGACGMAGTPGGIRKSEDLYVMRQIGIGRNQRLLLVRMGERCLLLGVSSEAVTLLLQLEGEEAKQWFEQTENAVQGSGFMDVLREHALKKK